MPGSCFFLGLARGGNSLSNPLSCTKSFEYNAAYWYRFDFGVPLEDIYCNEALHPRLKYLFSKAYESFKLQDEELKWILRERQGSLHERLHLKDQLVSAYDYQTISFFPAGVYFWVLRHFLGLLPIPLLPSYCGGAVLEWASLAEECKMYFKQQCQGVQCSCLEYDIAQVVNLLPTQHFVLLNVFIQFIRSLCVRKGNRSRHKFNKASLMVLSKFYCNALFSRPFRPGWSVQDHHLPLLVFLILRWKCICEYSCHYNSATKQESIDIYYTANKRSFQKDVDVQTEDLSTPNVQLQEAYKLTFIEEELEENSECSSENEQYKTAPEFHFSNTLEEGEALDWRSVLEETEKTVQKIDEAYIYDDYETFKKEEFNQVGHKKKNKSGCPSLSTIGKYILPQTSKCSTPKNKSSESTNSYLKYPDVCDQRSVDGSVKSQDDATNNKKIYSKSEAVPPGRKLFQDDSPVSVPEEGSTEKLRHDNNGTRKRNFAHSIRITLRFIRSLTPKKSMLKRVRNSIKYRRIYADQ